jgi:hypothetical protein
MSRVSTAALKSVPITTPELPFFEVGFDAHNLFSVREGVPIAAALNQALMFMHTSNDLLDVGANDPGMSERLSWGVNYLNQMARATVASVMSALDAAEEAT